MILVVKSLLSSHKEKLTGLAVDRLSILAGRIASRALHYYGSVARVLCFAHAFNRQQIVNLFLTIGSPPRAEKAG